MMMPLATGQLLHAFIFDRDCFPKVVVFTSFDLQSSILTSEGIRGFHHRPYPTIRPATAPFISAQSVLAKYNHNNRFSS